MTDSMAGVLLGPAGGVGESGTAPGYPARAAGKETADPQAFGRVLAEQTAAPPAAESGAPPPAAPAADGAPAGAPAAGRQTAGGSLLPPERPAAATARTASPAAARSAGNAAEALALSRPPLPSSPDAFAEAGRSQVGPQNAAPVPSRPPLPSSPDALAEAVRSQVGPQSRAPVLKAADVSSRSTPAAGAVLRANAPLTSTGAALDAPGRRTTDATWPGRAGAAPDALPGVSGNAAAARGLAAGAATPGTHAAPSSVPAAKLPDGETIAIAAPRALAGNAPVSAADGSDPSRAAGSRAAPAAPAGTRAMEAAADLRAPLAGDGLDGRGAAGTATARVAEVTPALSAAEARLPRPADAGASSTSTAAVAPAGPSVSPAGVSPVSGSMVATPVEGQYSLQAQPGDPAFGEELGVRMQVMVREGVREARLQLHPAELGRIQVTISTEGDSARVLFVADTAGAREAIEQSMPRLRDMLEQQGLQLAQSETQQRGAEGGNAGARDGLAMTSAEQGELPDDPADTVAGPRASTFPAGSVDTYA